MLPDYAEALAAVLETIKPLAAERVALDSALGLTLTSDIVADRDYPPFNRAQMDGYALRAADCAKGRRFPVIAEVAAGTICPVSIPPGACVKIATGAPVPSELDAVIEHERSDRADPVSFTLDSVDPWRSVHRCGSDARAGAVVLRAGTTLGPAHLGIAAMVGATTLSVHRRTRVAILTSGDEVVPPDGSPQSHQIRNSNAVMLAAAFGRFGGQVASNTHLPDEPAATYEAVEQALASASSINLLVTVGGVSAGERDFFPAALEKAGARFTLRGASLQPGRPITIGSSPHGQVIVCLPGNPVSSLVCAHLFGWPIVRRLAGSADGLPWRTAELAQPVKPNAQRRAFRPAQLDPDGRVSVPSWAGSGDLIHTGSTHGLLELPVQPELVAPGVRLRFLPWA
jgi:molybdopterin molybdotransferase